MCRTIIFNKMWTFIKSPVQYEKLLRPAYFCLYSYHRNLYTSTDYKITCLNCNTPRSLQKKYFCEHKSGNTNIIKKDIKAYIQQNKFIIRDTERKIKLTSSNILNDIKKTKDKVRETVGTVIEKDNIYTVPNLLCVLRIMLSPYLGMLIMQADFDFALAVLGFAAVTDLLDGWIARTWESQCSKMGSFLDPIADKVMIATLFLTLTYADLIPIALTSLIVARDILLVAAGFVIRYKSLPAPKTMKRYFDVTYATVQLAPTLISKVNTGVQLILVGTTLAAPVFHYVGHPLLEILWYVTGASTLAAGLSYVISSNTYKYIRTKK